jgi:Ca-activated chloride channel homolog
MGRCGWKENGSPMRRSLAAFSLACAGAAGALWAQQETLIRVDVRLVRVLATVKNAAGAAVGTLAKEDFEILDNGVPQRIAVFERHTEQPLSVALLVDISGSTAKELKSQLDSVSRFLNALFGSGHPDDAVALYSFNWQVTKHNAFTSNQRSLERSLKTFKAEAGTALYDAIFLASEGLDGREGRRVIVAVTDGGDTVSVKGFHAALEAAQMADAVIYPVLVMPVTSEAGRNIGGENALTNMARATGGQVFPAAVGPALDEAFSSIIADLRTQYLLGYYPTDTPRTANRFHTIQVRVRKPDLRVSARSGYYGDAEGDSGPAGGRISVSPQETRQEE